MTQQERFDRCLAEVLRLEGGYADDPDDAGGPTKFGVTRTVLSEARGRPVSAGDVASLGEAEAVGIYRERYWLPLCCWRLPSGLDLAVFDAAVNMGPAASARMLQQALGVVVDGHVGPVTVAAAGERPTREIIRSVMTLRRGRYRSLAGFPVFGEGWLRRADAIESLALAWAHQMPGEGTR